MKPSRLLPLAKLILLLAAPAAAKLPAGLALTEANYLDETCAFKPDPSALGGLKTGDVIDKSNFKQAESVLPRGLKVLIEEYGLKLPLGEYKPVLPSKGYIEATEKYSRGVELVDTGRDPRKRNIRNYTAGLPFPKPQNGTEEAWNFQQNYLGDQAFTQFKTFWISPKRGVERTQSWDLTQIIRTLNRTDVEPKPAIPYFQEKDLWYAGINTAREPYDVQGLNVLYYLYNPPRDGLQWAYIPSLRRVRQLSFGLRGDALNSTDLFLEDYLGYTGYIEWQDWTLVEKRTMPGVLHAGIPDTPDAYETVFSLKDPPHIGFQVPWEPRPVYVVEATSRFKNYPYSKMVFYIDAETHYILFKEGYDRKGELWKTVLLAYNQRSQGMPADLRIIHVVDHRLKHATLFYYWGWRYNDPAIKPSDFTISAIRKQEKR